MKNQKGFTLIEIFAIIAITMILAGMAIPEYQNHIKMAYNSTSDTAIRNIISAQHANHVNERQYVSCTEEQCSIALPGFKNTSPELHITTSANNNSSPKSFTVSAWHEKGSIKFDYNSKNKEIVQTNM